MDYVKWGCAFALGVTSHWYLSSSKAKPPPKGGVTQCKTSHEKEDAEEDSNASDSDSDDDVHDEDTLHWEPHKMVLVVRNDLKMGKGKVAAQCGHATLGAYKRAVKRTPHAIECWETLGQAKVALKVESEGEMMELASRAKDLGLVHYIVVDAGRTQIASNSRTVLAVGPAPIGAINNLTGHLKLM
ncbi:peptidyl-tRNA hydrolase [Aphanomyces invadans]|uniref:peptidyl-tRNA hydrolase n=1 Tax=Aphanomyces invadans TaxID=157072 RepID=A0A024UDJ9_9STRA|nr:peptidyl-tRNA hydrolase [Aphanomyces invadans]ETW04466.1 peptidyl-tRNA hydrolase [Aphanomyces invadans]|eukprot:XP_008867422.1 peptidyl-tRNA hydrolase [Aphanomyces invadans]